MTSTVQQLGSAAFAGDATAPARARRYVRGLLGGAIHDVLELLTSELVTNSYVHGGRHGRGTVTVTLTRVDDLLRVEVVDEGGDGEPVVIDDPDGLTGRGLLLIDRLATRWGTSAGDTGRTTWFEVRAEL